MSDWNDVIFTSLVERVKKLEEKIISYDDLADVPIVRVASLDHLPAPTLIGSNRLYQTVDNGYIYMYADGEYHRLYPGGGIR